MTHRTHRDRLSSCARRALAALAGLLAACALAQPATNDSKTGGARSANEAPVVVLNRTVAILRAPFLGMAPQVRARRTESRIAELVALGGPGVVTVKRESQGNVILIDGSAAIALVDEDADGIAARTSDAAAAQAAQVLSRVLADTREARDRGRILAAAGRSALATAAFLLAAWLLWRLREGLYRRAAALLEAQGARVQVGGTALMEGAGLRSFARRVAAGLIWLVLAVVAYQWLVYVFGQFPYTRPWSEELGDFLLGIVRHVGGGVLRSTPDLVIALVIFVIARTVIAAFRPLFDRVQSGETAPIGWLDENLAGPTRRIFNLGVWLFALVMAYPYLPGSDSDAFKGVSVLVGVMVTLGGSSLVGHAVSGIVLMYTRTVHVGDYLRVGDKEGTVVNLGTFTTKLRTGHGVEISVPNSVIMGTTSENYSRNVQGGPGSIIETGVTIGYDTPWRQVQALLVEAAARTGDIAAAPAPRVLNKALTDFYVDYRLVCHAQPREGRNRGDVLHALHANILDVFNEHGVQIMSPNYEADPETPKIVPRDSPFAAPAP